MRNYKLLAIVVLILVVVCFSFVLQAQDRQHDKKNRHRFESALSEKQFKRCGLDKLTEGERDELFSTFSTGTLPSYAPEGAKHYMEKEGWRLVRVIGAVEADDNFDDYWPVVWDNYEVYTLDPFGSMKLPDPGVYWAKNTLSSWTILYPDGEEMSFTQRDMN